MNTIQDFQKFGQANTETSMKMFGDWAKNWQAISMEMTDYSKRAFQDGQATLEKLMTAKSMEQALEIQTSYTKRAFEEYMQQMTKIGSMYTSFGREAYKPLERAVQSVQTMPINTMR
jgi:hypothetical protein